MKGPFEVVGSLPTFEVHELDQAVSEKDLALADGILARLLVRLWAAQRAENPPQNGQNSLDNRAPASPHVAGHG